jgi:ankyrin repeat protein
MLVEHLNVADHLGKTVLMHALEQGNSTLVDHILTACQGKDQKEDATQTRSLINVVDISGRCPLHYLPNNKALVEKILSLEAVTFAHLSYKDSHGRTPLMLLAENGSVEVFEAVASKCTGQQFSQLIKERDNGGKTVLHYAAYWDRVNLIPFLVSYNLDVNSQDTLGNTPLHMAAEQNGIDVFTEMIKYGPNLEIRNQKGLTALEIMGRRLDPKQLSSLRIWCESYAKCDSVGKLCLVACFLTLGVGSALLARNSNGNNSGGNNSGGGPVKVK